MEENDLRVQEESGDRISATRMSSGSISHNDLMGITGSERPESERYETERDDRDAAAPISNKHNITIHSLDFGYNVKIGCQNFAVESVDRLIKNLEAYLNEPRETEKKWMKERKLLY